MSALAKLYSTWGASQVAVVLKEPTFECRRYKEMWVQSLGGEGPMEEGTATDSSILAWRMPWTEEPGGL